MSNAKKPKYPYKVPVSTSLIDGKKTEVGTATVYEDYVEYEITDPRAIALIQDDSFDFSLDR